MKGLIVEFKLVIKEVGWGVEVLGNCMVEWEMLMF